MKSIRLHYVIITLLLMLLILSAAAAAGLHGNTLIVWWKPAVTCIILSLPAGAFIAGRCKWIAQLTHSSVRAVNFIIASSASVVITLGMFYSINYFCADTTTKHAEKAVVLSKYREKHYRTRRLSRNRSVRGENYYMYHLSLRFADGLTKDITVPPQQYSKVRTGDSIIYAIQRGLFGIPVIKNRKIPVEHSTYRFRKH